MNIVRKLIVMPLFLASMLGCSTNRSDSFVRDIAFAYQIKEGNSLDSIVMGLKSRFPVGVAYSDILEFINETKSRSTLKVRYSIVDKGDLVGLYFKGSGQEPQVGFMFKFKDGKLLDISYFRVIEEG